MPKTYLYIVICFVFASCTFFKGDTSKEKGKLIARVYDEKLYEEDLEKLFPKNISKEDSVEVAELLIHSWAKQQLLFLKFQINMPNENQELEKLVEKYRKDLFVNSFREALIKQKLDTIVTNDQIVSYYAENKESFKVNEELVKFKYIKLKENHKKRNEFKRMLLSKGKNDLQLLDEENTQFLSHFLSDSIWIRYKDFLKELPVLKNTQKTKVLKPSNFLLKRDSSGVYYVYITKVLYRNEIAPVRYISKVIKKMILHKRKLELVKSVENVLVDDAIKKKQFEIY